VPPGGRTQQPRHGLVKWPGHEAIRVGPCLGRAKKTGLVPGYRALGCMLIYSAACQRNGQDTINVVGHITCQKGGQAVCPLRNKCGGRAAQSPYVMLHPLAYVTDNQP
jgi:hypothetical protein